MGGFCMEICDEKKCTGCMACANICPQKCIDMKYNSEFELHPMIDNSKCIFCGKCKKICPVYNKQHKKTTMSCYAGYSKTHRKNSASGGLASALSKYIINIDGVVCGCIFDGNAHHILTNEPTLISAMKGSKYVQSIVGDCYIQIKRIITEKKCLFIGTPCQVAALKSVVGETENLFCVDLICHGVPSPHFLNDILAQYDYIYSVAFRDKGIFSLKINNFENKMSERYMTAFLSGMSYRESCYMCSYAENKRVGDITLGDFWEIKGFRDTKYGVSCILINSEKGQELLNAIDDDVYLEERNVKEAYFGNPQLCHPTKKHRNRNKFLSVLKKTGSFDKAVKASMKKERFKSWLKKRNIVIILLKMKNRSV